VKNGFVFDGLSFCLAKAGLGLTVFGLLCSCGQRPSPPDAGGVSSAPATNPPVVARPEPAFEKLTGRWERPDGGYILDISAVEAGGKLQAAYFNPSGAIHVSRAFALKEGDNTKVFVELRDTGYPGCTYSLKYDPQVDQLFGEYFQAAMQQTYDVTFARLK
jgi:hypothetical protein